MLTVHYSISDWILYWNFTGMRSTPIDSKCENSVVLCFLDHSNDDHHRQFAIIWNSCDWMWLLMWSYLYMCTCMRKRKVYTCLLINAILNVLCAHFVLYDILVYRSFYGSSYTVQCTLSHLIHGANWIVWIGYVRWCMCGFRLIWE